MMKRGANLTKKKVHRYLSEEERHRWSGGHDQRCLKIHCHITRTGVAWNRRKGFKTTCPTTKGAIE